MPKKRKTKRQRIQAGRVSQTAMQTSSVPDVRIIQHKIPEKFTLQTSSVQNTLILNSPRKYLRAELSKTGLLSLIIILIEILLYVLLRNHILVLSNIPYWKGVTKMAMMYCVKCREKREDENAVEVTMKNGKPALKGKCPVCGTGMYKIGKAK